MAQPHVVEVATLRGDEVDAVLRLRDQVAAASGVSPLSDHVVSEVRGRSAGRHFVQTMDSQVAGYAHLGAGDHPAAELLVGPKGDAGSLLEMLTAAAGPELRVWTRGDAAPLNHVLPGLGYALTRTLLQLRRPIDGSPLPEPVWPEGVTVHEFRPGVDEAEWLTVNNRAFAGHPEQSGWTLAEIESREREEWFDASGFFVAELDGRIVGFHWTKDHGGALGEVYVIGVDPSMQGKRLGEALLLRGLQFLRDNGARTVLLYVESDNHGALALYERLGFTRWDADRTFSRAG